MSTDKSTRSKKATTNSKGPVVSSSQQSIDNEDGLVTDMLVGENPDAMNDSQPVTSGGTQSSENCQV